MSVLLTLLVALSQAVAHEALFTYSSITTNSCKLLPKQYFSDFCLSLNVKDDRFSIEAFSSFLEQIDKANKTVRQAKISFHHQLTHREMLELGDQLDTFLTPRLWWSVIVEPYLWHENVSKQGIFLKRYNPTYEPFLRLQSAIQYPDAQTCNKTFLIIDHFDGYHIAWGNNLWIRATLHNHFPFTPYTTYNSLSNNASDERESTAWIAAHECNTTVNKWECAFLPRTNCTLPNQLTKCKGNHCVTKLGESFDGATLYNKASAEGTVVPPKQALEIYIDANEHYDKQRPLNDLQKRLYPNSDPPAYTVIAPHKTDMPITINLPMTDSRDATYIFRSILRNNYRFRSLIAEFIHNFYMKNNINFTTRCVTAQVRRGDRIIRGVNMIELCKNATKPVTEKTDKNQNNQCMDFDGELKWCGDPTADYEGGIAFDKGCESPVPFGAVTIDMVIRAAKQLAPPEVKTIFVSTDDETWLEREKIIAKKQHPEWLVVNLEAPKLPPNEKDTSEFTQGYEYMRFKSGAHSGAFFLASLQLAQQCEAFTGHFTSTVPQLFVSAMCHKSRNGQLEGACPPVYDLRTGLI